MLLLSAGAVIPLIGVFSVPQSCREEHGHHRCQDGCRPFGLKPGEARKYPTCRATTHPRYSLGSLRDPILFSARATTASTAEGSATSAIAEMARPPPATLALTNRHPCPISLKTIVIHLR